MNYKKGLILLLFFLTSFTIAFLVRNPKTLKQLFIFKTEIKFESKMYDFGELEYKKAKGVYFIYKNIGSNSLKIENITSSCGCTIPKWSKKKLKSNEVDSLFVNYDSQSLGYFSKSIYVYSNSETSPDVLYINGIVKK